MTDHTIEEQERIKERRGKIANFPRNQVVVGFALSGGGIRSATFCLGFFQALAKLKQLKNIDYLSTISGGGYFGGFLGALFCRNKDNKEWSVEDALSNPKSFPISWLRENGRYLSPNGSGDLLHAGTILLRNWLTLHVVLLLFLAAFFFFICLVEQIVTELGNSCLLPFTSHFSFDINNNFYNAFKQGHLQIFIFLIITTFTFFVLPLGWSYWLIKPCHTQQSILSGNPVYGALFTSISLAILLTISRIHNTLSHNITLLLELATLSSLVTLGLFCYYSKNSNKDTYHIDSIHYMLTEKLKFSLILFLAFHVFALIEWLGLILSTYNVSWVGIGYPLFIVAAGLFNKIGLQFGDKTNKSRLRLNWSIFFYILALFFALLICITLSWFVHYITSDKSLTYIFILLIVTLIMSLLFGHTISFLNQSSQHEFYQSRLKRAYIGASNTTRNNATNVQQNKVLSVSNPIDGDDILMKDYKPWEAGGPLHILSVTVNETVDGRSQIQQQDRKGTSLAIGPCGFSLGASHHAAAKYDTALLNSRKAPSADSAAKYDVFNPYSNGESGADFHFENLSLGQWIGISGAAFTTGLGAKTNLGLSFLLGFFNVRLGYWWDSGIDTNLKAYFYRFFPVQTHLMNELLARFHGTARKRWYLSDGGHFENLGGYELIRRKIPFIVILDSEADPDYQFEGLGNLVRKARIDFQAKIEFLSTTDARTLINSQIAPYIGGLDLLKRGKWTTQNGIPSLEEQDRCGLTKVHAALAKISYSDATTGTLLYIKPSLIGDEPIDIQHYNKTHVDFPHETTMDQFFDEAQWESYRMIGELIGEKLFTPVTKGSWQPSEFKPL